MVFTNRLGPISKLDYRAKTHRGRDVKVTSKGPKNRFVKQALPGARI